SVRYPERVVLVFGRESAGLPLGMRKRYHDRLVAIPMLDPALRSLNLSSAVAVALYEVLRQREAAPAVAAAERVRELAGKRAGERELAASGEPVD
ncbi:MAG: hypothetical protein JOZ15_05675, partial [Acidobacteria bacterium]|nr:hypothetical protein [Acidobacteriota bacterium]